MYWPALQLVGGRKARAFLQCQAQARHPYIMVHPRVHNPLRVMYSCLLVHRVDLHHISTVLSYMHMRMVGDGDVMTRTHQSKELDTCRAARAPHHIISLTVGISANALRSPSAQVSLAHLRVADKKTHEPFHFFAK